MTASRKLAFGCRPEERGAFAGRNRRLLDIPPIHGGQTRFDGFSSTPTDEHA